MKHYPKTYEDLYRERGQVNLNRIEAFDGDTPGLVKQLQGFFNTSFKDLFRMAITYSWLEKQITYNGERRMRRWRNGHVPDQTFGRFMSQEVGIDQSALTRSRWFTMSTYFIATYFPDFLEHDPFEEPDWFQYPYDHATLDFWSFVYQIENARELMDHAEENEMSFHDFRNWVTNYVLSYNEEQEEEVYGIGRSRDGTSFIRYKHWDKYPLDSIYEATKKTETDSN
jgi:hypothetical protein